MKLIEFQLLNKFIQAMKRRILIVIEASIIDHHIIMKKNNITKELIRVLVPSERIMPLLQVLKIEELMHIAINLMLITE